MKKLFLSLCLLFAALTPFGASAQEEGLNKAEARDLVARLSDAEVRDLLLQRLDAVAEAATAQQIAPGGADEFLYMMSYGVFGVVVDAVSRLPTLLSVQFESIGVFISTAGASGIVLMLGVLAVALVAGALVERLFDHKTKSRLERAAARAESEEESLKGAVQFLLIRLMQDLAGVLIFLFIALEVTNFFAGLIFAAKMAVIEPYIRLIWVWLIVLPRFAFALTRFVLAPARARYRLVHADDKSAKFLSFHLTGLVFLIGFTVAVVRFNTLNGFVMEETRIAFWLNLAVHIYVGWIAWKARAGLADMLRGGEDVTPLEERVAGNYARFAIVVSAAMWWLVTMLSAYGAHALLQQAPHFSTMLLLLVAPAFDTCVRGLVRHLTPPDGGEGEVAEKAWALTQRSLVRIGRVLVFGFTIYLLGRVWGISFFALADEGGAAFGDGRLLACLMVAAAGYLVWEVIALLIYRKLARERSGSGEEEEVGGEGGPAGGASRVATVLPLLLRILKTVITVIFGLIAIGALGVDVTPLLAGAGVVGLAIGFGAQKLVADIVSGVFFLLDDAFRIGEYVDVQGTLGTVEHISVRSLRLRHHKGAVHTIPYSEIPQVTNYSRDWVIVKLKFPVHMDTDPNKVKKLFKQIGKDLQEVPEYADMLLQPFKSQGVFDISDGVMVIRGKFMAKPGQQFMLRKEIYNRVKAAFKENDIHFARREVNVAIPEMATEKLTREEKAAIAAGAEAAAEKDGEKEGGKGKG